MKILANFLLLITISCICMSFQNLDKNLGYHVNATKTKQSENAYICHFELIKVDALSGKESIECSPTMICNAGSLVRFNQDHVDGKICVTCFVDPSQQNQSFYQIDKIVHNQKVYSFYSTF
ncbi:MAG: hypothetical protein Tsb0021_09710 [Chlamydiales bacterium]